MPISDLPMSKLVALFLSVFVLIGIYPSLKRASRKLRQLLDSKSLSHRPAAFGSSPSRTESLFNQPLGKELNDYEIIVFRRIAQADQKPLSRKQLNANLLLGDQVLISTLDALIRRGLVHITISPLLGQRYVLTKAGRSYAIELGYIIQFVQK